MEAAATHHRAVAELHRLWAYVTLALTGIVTEEATPLIGGLAAHDARLRLSLVGMWVAVGTWGADLGLYYVGRWRGNWLRRRWPALRQFWVRMFRVVRRHPWRSSCAVRWAYGLRLTLPIACGAAQVPLPVYLIGSAVSCVTWAYVYTLIGWGFGRTTLIVLGHVRRYENAMIVVIVVLLAVVFWYMHRRHVEDEVVDVLSSGDEVPVPSGSDDE